MCFIVVKELKCVTQFSSAAAEENPIAPKSVSAFYGAAKIDKLFELQKVEVKLFDKTGSLVPLQCPVVLVELFMTVAWQIHAQTAEGVNCEFTHE